MSGKYIRIYDKDGGSPIQLDLESLSSGAYRVVNNLLQALSDAQQSGVVSLGAQSIDTLLAGGVTVDMNTVAVTPLFTVPAGKTCVITHVIVRSPSISLTTASWALGFKGASYNDYATTATHTGLNATNKAIVMQPPAAETVGAAADVFSANVTIQQGAPATAVFDVYGYLI